MPKLPDHLVLRGWESEEEGHRANLARALELASRHLDSARQALAEGKVDTFALRQLGVEAAEADRHGFALDAVRKVRFALPADETAKGE